MKPWKVLVAAAAVTLVAGPATASARSDDPAGDLRSTAQTVLSCTTPLIENPFLAFGDDLDYVLAPNGSFEGDGGWQLDRAAIVDGDDPFDLRPGADERMLSLPEDSEATTALMCVDPSYPIFRFPVKATAGKANVRVEVAYPWSKAGSKFRKSDSFKLDGDEGWTLSPQLDLDPDRGGDGPGWRPMAIRLIAKKGDVVLDDVYVDPRARW